MRSTLASLCLALVASCGPRFAPLELPEGCQPLLAGHDCMLPYPSDFHRVADASLPSGHRVLPQGAGRVLTQRGANADTTVDWAVDGYSRIPVIITAFDAHLSAQGLPGLFDPPSQSLSDDSPTFIVDAETLERVPHFADLDPNATDPRRQALILRPLVRLKERSRYLVALRGLVQPDGSKVTIPEGFRRLRDQQSAGDPRLEPLQKHFDRAVFPLLERAGLSRKDLTLAWDFTTGSDEQVERDMLRVRELTLAWLATHTPAVEVTEVLEDPASNVWRRIRGRVTGPLFLKAPEPGNSLARDEAGNVVLQGTAQFDFTAQIPISLKGQAEPGTALPFGHGFFGTRAELETEATRRISDRLRAVTFGIDWWGMSAPDLPKLADRLTNRPARAYETFERVPQAMANWLVFSKAIGAMRDQPAFRRPPGQPNAGQPIFDGAATTYLGISQGHVLGGTMAALNPAVRRACLNAGGAGLSHMMFRAYPFGPFLELLRVQIKDPLEVQKWAATLQRQFDRFESGTYANYLATTTLPHADPGRRVLMQIGLGDTMVPNLGSLLHARLTGLAQLGTGVPAQWGLEQVDSPHDGSALALYDFGLDTRALYDRAEFRDEGNDVHQRLRVLEPAMAQMEEFFRTGVIRSSCNGRCDPD